MSARVELGGERYIVDAGHVHAEKDEVLHAARAKYLEGTAQAWVDEARRDGLIPHYDPDPDCTMAKVIANHIKGRYSCAPAPPAEPGQRH